jgi:glucose/arabinose dehydrogenase
LALVAVVACQSRESDSATPAPGDDSSPANPLITEQGGLCRGIALPEDQAYLGADLCVRAVALEQGKLRQLTFSSAGDLLGVTSDGAIVRYRDTNQDGYFSGGDEIRTIARTGAKNGNNAAFDADQTYLYAGSLEGVRRFRYSSRLDDLGAGEDVVLGEPSSGTHSLHTVKVYDGYLYVHSGSEANAADPASPDYDTERSVLKRFWLADFAGRPFEWADGELYFGGIRNMVGFTQNPGDGALYGVVNGLDDLVYQGVDVHLDNPGEDLIRLEQGKAHGYPYCFTAAHIVKSESMVPAGSQLAAEVPAIQPNESPLVNPHDDEWCRENSTEPLTFFPPHSAPLDILFVKGAAALPPEWEGSALVTLHGSWDTTPSVGHQVVRIPLQNDGTMPMPTAMPERTTFSHEVIFGGAEGEGAWGWASGVMGEYPVRPVGIAVSPVDGALYVSSDNAPVYQGVDAPNAGVIYRIARRRL